MQCYFPPIWKQARNGQPFSFTHPWSCWSVRRGACDLCIWSMLAGGGKCLKSTFLSFDKYIWRVASIDLHFSRARLYEVSCWKCKEAGGWIWSMQESWVSGYLRTLQLHFRKIHYGKIHFPCKSFGWVGYLASDVQGHPGRHVLRLPLERMNDITK